MDKLDELIAQKVEEWNEPGSVGWDSLTRINILMETEKLFGIRFAAEDVDGIVDEQTLRAYVERKTGDVASETERISASGDGTRETDKARAGDSSNETVLPIAGKKRVLVLDCDGVLWDGIAGENTHLMLPKNKAIQEQVLALEARGVLICLCSKNEPGDVWDAIQHFGIIKSSHIVDQEISWEPKPFGIRRLSDRLNLPLQHFVFIDDSDAEIAEVSQALPEVECIKFDMHWPATVEFLLSICIDEGRSRTEDYRNAIAARASFSDLLDDSQSRQEFLNALGMESVIAVNDQSLVARCAELSQKTNQFNFRLCRFNEEDIRTFCEVPDFVVFCGSMKDRFGDHGWTALAVFINNQGAEWYLTEFCVSCRVIGRGFEKVFIDACYEYCRTMEDLPMGTAYRKGLKNQQCEDFFSRQHEMVPHKISFKTS